MNDKGGLAEALAGWPPPVLDPAGPYAEPVTTLACVLFAGGALVLLIVLVALGIALFGGATVKARLGGERAIWIGGFAFPLVVLTALLVWGLSLTSDLSRKPDGSEMRVRITGEMWWWRVDYLDGAGRIALRDANELHISVGRPVVLELESADVIHSFWVPRLSGKVDMVPGRRNLMRIEARAPGVYGGQCAEYCGVAHALMGFVVVAHAPADYARWLQSRRMPPRHSDHPGAALFLTSGCAACHTIRGTPANGLAGPDLSHVGSRRSLGAGVLPNNRGTLAGWIADSQTIKPKNRMPAYKMLSGAELQALAAYMESLK